MRSITKTQTPAFFTQDTINLSNWDDYLGKDKRAIKKHILDNEQKFLCCYCESKVDVSLVYTHLEHLKPKEIYSDLTFDYNNLLVSCDGKHETNTSNNSHQTCGHKKDNDYDENLFLNPVAIADIENYFKYDSQTGRIINSESNSNRADYTIRVLQLNGVNDSIAVARFNTKNTLIKTILNKSKEPKAVNEMIEKILEDDSIAYISFLRYCFNK